MRGRWKLPEAGRGQSNFPCFCNPLRSRTPLPSGIVTTEATAVMNFVEMALALRRGSGQPIPLGSKVGAKATHPRQTAPMRGRWKLPLPLQKPDGVSPRFHDFYDSESRTPEFNDFMVESDSKKNYDYQVADAFRLRASLACTGPRAGIPKGITASPGPVRRTRAKTRPRSQGILLQKEN